MKTTPKITTVTEYLTTLSPKNKRIVKEIFSLTKKVEPKIQRVCRFNFPFFDLNGRLFYVSVQTKDRKKDTLTIWFCQGVSVIKNNPVLDLVLEWQKEGLKTIRKLKIDSLEELKTYHFAELLQIMVDYNKQHNTHKEWAQNHRKLKKNTK